MGPFFSLCVAMKVEACYFSGFRIHPGHGKKIIKNDSKQYWIINKKIEKHFWDKKNPRKVPWTLVFRKIHKKGLAEDTKRKRTRKQQKVTRAIVGAPIEMITKRRTMKPEQRKSAREAALRKAKEEKKKTQQEKRKTNQPRQKDNRAKNQKGGKGR